MFRDEGLCKAIRFCFTWAQTWALEEIPELNGLGQQTLLGNSALITLDEKKKEYDFLKKKTQPIS